MTLPVIVDCGVVSPFGVGVAALDQGLRFAQTAIQPLYFEGIGTLPVAPVDDWIPPIDGDRTLAFLAACHRQLSPETLEFLRGLPPSRVGISAATSKGAFLTMAEQPFALRDRLTALLPDAPAHFLARLMGSVGPRNASVAACATFLANLHTATLWLKNDLADAVVVASAEATLTPLYLQSFLALGAHSRVGSFPFDQRHDGFVAGEGAGLVVLMRENFARASGLKPQVRLRSIRLGAEAHHSTAVEPTGQRLKQFLQATIAAGGLRAAQIDGYACHGTGTPLGDGAEARALGAINPRAVLSFKGAIGHLMGAAGAVEFIACLLAMQGSVVYPAVGCLDPTEEAASLPLLQESNQQILHRILKWNIGFGGYWAAVLLERIE